jgi:hypothetical protein
MALNAERLLAPSEGSAEFSMSRLPPTPVYDSTENKVRAWESEKCGKSHDCRFVQSNRDGMVGRSTNLSYPILH